MPDDDITKKIKELVDLSIRMGRQPAEKRDEILKDFDNKSNIILDFIGQNQEIKSKDQAAYLQQILNARDQLNTTLTQQSHNMAKLLQQQTVPLPLKQQPLQQTLNPQPQTIPIKLQPTPSQIKQQPMPPSTLKQKNWGDIAQGKPKPKYNNLKDLDRDMDKLEKYFDSNKKKIYNKDPKFLNQFSLMAAEIKREINHSPLSNAEKHESVRKLNSFVNPYLSTPQFSTRTPQNSPNLPAQNPSQFPRLVRR